MQRIERIYNSLEFCMLPILTTLFVCIDAVMTSPNDASSDQLAQVVLYAEFDIDKGSTLRESYPYAIDHYSPEFFADLMLPEGIHNREDDFTVFFLNRKTCLDSECISSDKDDIKPVREFMYC